MTDTKTSTPQINNKVIQNNMLWRRNEKDFVFAVCFSFDCQLCPDCLQWDEGYDWHG